MIDDTFGGSIGTDDAEDEVDANFYGKAASKIMTSVPLGKWQIAAAFGVPHGLLFFLGSTPFANYQPQKAGSAAFELGVTRTTPSPSSEENTFNSHHDSEDNDDYLKPATDEESKRWSSEGTRATDLLF